MTERAVFNINSARDFLHKFMWDNFQDKTFYKYIEHTLAGDYACELAEAIRKLQTPAGYKLVPIEPTPEMLVAGDTYARQNSPKAGIWWLRRVYETMISAAPEVS